MSPLYGWGCGKVKWWREKERAERGREQREPNAHYPSVRERTISQSYRHRNLQRPIALLNVTSSPSTKDIGLCNYNGNMTGNVKRWCREIIRDIIPEALKNPLQPLVSCQLMCWRDNLPDTRKSTKAWNRMSFAEMWRHKGSYVTSYPRFNLSFISFHFYL